MVEYIGCLRRAPKKRPASRFGAGSCLRLLPRGLCRIDEGRQRALVVDSPVAADSFVSSFPASQLFVVASQNVSEEIWPVISQPEFLVLVAQQGGLVAHVIGQIINAAKQGVNGMGVRGLGLRLGIEITHVFYVNGLLAEEVEAPRGELRVIQQVPIAAR